jgi:hypothetical protein
VHCVEVETVLLKLIKVTSITLLMAGCILMLSATNGAIVKPGSYFQTSKQKFNVIVITPGTEQKQTVANRSNSQSAAGTSPGAQQLPNYKGETLTLGLLSK